MNIFRRIQHATGLHYSALHFIAGFYVALTASLLFSPLFCLMMAISAGVGKEIWDKHNNGNPDWTDILFTFLGGLLYVLLDWLLPTLL